MEANPKEEIRCSNCKALIDDNEHYPVQLSCECLICKKCKTQEALKDPQNANEFNCKVCNDVAEICFLGKKAAQGFINQNKSSKIIHCGCNQSKEIEFYSKKHERFVCAQCIVKLIPIKDVEEASTGKIRSVAQKIMNHIKNLQNILQECYEGLDMVEKFDQNISGSQILDLLNQSIQAVCTPFIKDRKEFDDITRYSDLNRPSSDIDSLVL